MRILLVEDERRVASFIGRALRENSYAVDLAETGEKALALATEPIGPLPAGTQADEMAAWTVVANVLLNLDGVMTKS